MKFYAKKKFSQNFLHDNDIINRIIKIINPKFLDVLIEIGPGLSALTNPICQLIKRLFVIEIDKNLVNILKKSIFLKKLKIFTQDVLNFNFNKLYKKKILIRIFGNIPYNISTPLLMHLFKYVNIIDDIHIMLQKEFADRLLANPGSKKYGRLSIISQYYYKITKLLTIKPHSFYPKPKIYSVFILLKPHNKNKYNYLKNVNILSLITFLAFSNRRKFLYKSLSLVISKRNLIKLNINPFLRPENITLKQYCNISNYLS